MIALQTTDEITHIPPGVAQNYISEMLEELVGIANTAGLRELSSLLKLTLTATQVDMDLEIEA